MATKARTYFDDKGDLHIRPYRIKDLAAIYGVCARTLRHWMEQNGIREDKKTCKYFSIAEVLAIVNALGFPQTLTPPNSSA